MGEALNCTQEEFLKKWGEACIEHDARIMAYHCTRHSNQNNFLKYGVLPLSNYLVKFNEARTAIKDNMILTYRFTKATGPFFYISYRAAKKSGKHYLKSGAEIFNVKEGSLLNNVPEESLPLIIHCDLPFSILPSQKLYAYYALRAFFEIIDPDGEPIGFEGASIDLKGRALDPKYIVKIEEV